jgi:hypothetical protein
MSSSNDFVKFVTQQIVSYMDQPKEERREVRQRRKEERPPMSSHLFGMIPFAVRLWFKRKKKGA